VDFLREPKPLQTPQPLPNIDLYKAPQIDLGQAPLIDTGERGPDTITLPVPPVVAPLPPQRPTPPPVKRVSGGPGKGFPATDDYYPAASIRLGEQGSAAIQVCVDPSGKLTAEPQVMKSSGSSRLDEGALRLAKAGSGHYRATTENGTPVSSCYGYLITFNLK